MGPVITVGHGTLDEHAFAELVRAAGVEVLLDIRRYPGSRRFPHFGAGRMAEWLPTRDVGYLPLESLGGRRRPSEDSPNTAWRNAQFAAYADHMASPEFAAGIDELRDLAADDSVAIMCSESVWWRCHRRLVADHLVLVEDIAVRHLFHDGRLDEHDPMAEAVRVGDHVEYPAAQGELPL